MSRALPLTLILASASALAQPGAEPTGEDTPHDQPIPALANTTGDAVTNDLIAIQKGGGKLFRREARAVRRTDSITIDGKLTEASWAAAPMVHYEWQESPNEGAIASSPTEFKVVYDDDATYIGVHALEADPKLIRGVLHPALALRKIPQSDWIIVLLDPRLNRRIAYGFAVNAAGVMLDIRSFADVPDVDDSFSPVWEARTSRDGTGWFVELRIPHSQTRVLGGPQGKWGFQVLRRFARTQERSYWSPFTFRSGMDVKGYGTLVIDDKIDVGRPLELRPYVLGGGQVRDLDSADRVNDALGPRYGAGLDVNFQALDSTRITATLNPDFGQVETDPSLINLTAQENFFTERRPFFVQDLDLFKLGIGRGNESLFYSRRIGARPHVTQRGTAEFARERDATTILGAMKLTSELGQGFHVAALSAVTREETSEYQLADGTIDEAAIEPLTAYNVLQLNSTFRGGASDFRAVGTAVNRRLSDTGIQSLHEQAYTGGMQYLHSFRENRWQAFGQVAASHVEGPATAIAQTQQANQRIYQRPDAEHLDLDPTRTKLDGYAFNGQLRKIAGYWQGVAGVDGRSPGFETNDAGFQLDADVINPFGRIAYYDSTVKSGAFREKSIAFTADAYTDFAPDLLRYQGGVAVTGVRRNNSTLSANATYTHGVLDTRMLRGGPAVTGEDVYTLTLGRDGDQSKDFAVGMSLRGQLRPESSSWFAGGTLSLRWNIRPNFEVLITPDVGRIVSNNQYVSTVQDPTGSSHYLLGKLRQWEFRAVTRVEFTMSPQMAIQLYAEPFLSAGRYAGFVDVTNPRGDTYDSRFSPIEDARISAGPTQIQIDTDGDGVLDATVPQPSFRFGSLLTNLVFRWEYRPGSFLHLIWSQAQRERSFDPSLDVADAFTGRRDHVVLAKLSYWWNL